jgi:hypothetical protein
MNLIISLLKLYKIKGDFSDSYLLLTPNSGSRFILSIDIDLYYGSKNSRNHMLLLPK